MSESEVTHLKELGSDWHPDQLSPAQEEYVQVRNTLAEIEASHDVALGRIRSLESNYNTAFEAWNAEIQERKLQAYNRELAEAEVARLKEALEAAEQDVGEQRAEAEHWARRAEAAEARVRELEERDAQRDHAWSVDVGHLRRAESECAAMRVENQHLRDVEDGQRKRAEKAENECAALRTELASSRKFWAESKELEINARLAAEARLDAANALLAEAPRDYLWPDWNERVAAHLANQPAAPCQETGVHRDCDCEDPRVVGYETQPAAQACTDAEQRVLDAMRRALVGRDEYGGYFMSSTSPVCLAELARREAKKQDKED